MVVIIRKGGYVPVFRQAPARVPGLSSAQLAWGATTAGWLSSHQCTTTTDLSFACLDDYS